MKRKHLINAMAIILTTGGLVACGGGGGDDDDDTITDPTTASKTVVGTIDGFGSIYVNGIKFETDSASYDVDDEIAIESDLAVGMKVKVEGIVNDDGVSGTANSIYYDDDVEGPIDSGSMVADVTSKSFTVLGMAILADANTTVYDDGAAFDTLAEGDKIEVSGYFDGAQIVATRIEKQENSDDEFEVKGTVESYDGSTIELSLQNLVRVSYPVNGTSEIAPGTSGQFVEVKLSDIGSGLEAIEIELEDDDLLDDDADEVDLYGVLIGDYNGGFMVNEVPLDLSNNPEYQPSTLENNLTEGMEVEVEGSMVNGILIVEEIEAEVEDEVEIEALVTNVVFTDNLNGIITLEMGNGVTLPVQSNNSTMLEDDSSSDSDDDGSFSLSELISGTDFVEVEAYLGDSSELIANKIKRKDSSSETTLEGPVDDFVSGDSITLVGITYSFDAETTFQVDENTPETDSTAFFSGLVLGDTVEIKDDEPNGIADEVSRDTSSD